MRALVLVTGDPSGDMLFAVTTGEVANERIDARDLGVVAAELARDAVLSSFDPEWRTGAPSASASISSSKACREHCSFRHTAHNSKH
jgi:L-aminopeptidase/D-esterase-like protein